MKTLFLLLFLLTSTIGITAQEYYFGISRTGTTGTQFARPAGLYVGYAGAINQDLKWAIDLGANACFSEYNLITLNLADGSGYRVNTVQPANWWISISSSLNFKVFSRGCLLFSAGPQISLNYFLCNELIRDIPVGNQTDRTYRDQDQFLNRPGIGVHLEGELKGLFRKKVSIITSMTPQVLVYGNLFQEGSSAEGLILASGTRIGLRYHF